MHRLGRKSVGLTTAMMMVVMTAAFFLVAAASASSAGGCAATRSAKESATPHPKVYTGTRDVCVVGGGAAGMATAVFAKDKGLSVAVFESSPRVGGQCNTVYFTPPAPGYPAWIDIGVQIFADTRYANELGLGPWSIDSVGLVKRFAGADSVVPLNYSAQTSSNYVVDLGVGIGVPASSANTSDPAYRYAYYTLLTILANYTWLDRAEVPVPVPAELLVPFSVYIATHGLEPLVSSLLEPTLFAGGLGDFDDLTTLYALLNLAPTVLDIFSVPDLGFSVYNGCQTIYDGMAAYLGDAGDGVLVNAQVQWALRPSGPHTSVLLGGVLVNPTTGAKEASFSYKCGKLVVAFPQVLSAAAVLGLGPEEYSLFSSVRTRQYITGTLTANEAAVAGQAFNLLNLNLTVPSAFMTPTLPAITQLTRGLSYGPIQFKASTASNDMSADAIETFVQQQLDGMPAWIMSDVVVTDLLIHEFQPHFSNAELERPGGAYQGLRNLQGHRNTYWVGALSHFAVSFQLWNAAYELVQQYF